MNTGLDHPREIASLGLGGNIGDPAQAMARALQALDARKDCRVITVSRLYLTPPWGKTDQADFFNCCALIETELHPEDLLDLCLALEREMKRVRIERWGPRTLDIDILTYGDIEQKTQALELPHPRMTERAFVMLPLADIAPHLMINGRMAQSWAGSLNSTGMRIAKPDGLWWRQVATAG
ncbi:6-hydroxymethyl-7,8-dihydropterin pyrophosphokinase [Neorhizobium sp. NCHU2750]|nr:6-hydroxymethyl-7,8-dihydropterin pyrophosphokinase [Neorhizobium sp. NCHU2750]